MIEKVGEYQLKDRWKNGEILQRIKKERNVLDTIK
jgi:hypothetical protein